MHGSRFAEILFLALEKFEATVKILVVLGCSLLLCGQLALTQAPARKYMSYVDRLEGHRIQGTQVNFAEGPLAITERTVTAAPGAERALETRMLVIRALEAMPEDKAVVLINGHDKVPFVHGEAALNLQEGDVVEIDASGMKRLLKFRIFAPHKDIAFPGSELPVEIKGNKALLGAVRFKH